MIRYQPADSSRSSDDPPIARNDADAHSRLADRDDLDLYCLQCGYNLRGLTGDPRRCPECGYRNPLGDLEVPAERISHQLKRMETAPAMALFGFVLLAAASTPWIYLLNDWLQGEIPTHRFARQAREILTSCYLFLPVAAIFLVIFGVTRFRDACRGRAGWLGALVRYQMIGMGLALLMAAAVTGPLAACIAGFRTFRSPDPDAWACVSMAALPAFGMVLVLWLARRVHGWLRRPMDQMMRETAVRIARDVLRRRLARR